MASGIDDEVTLRRNREDFLKFQLRPRRLVDVSKVDMSVDILGVKYDSPIVLAPVGGQRSFHDDAESGVVNATSQGNRGKPRLFRAVRMSKKHTCEIRCFPAGCRYLFLLHSTKIKTS